VQLLDAQLRDKLPDDERARLTKAKKDLEYRQHHLDALWHSLGSVLNSTVEEVQKICDGKVTAAHASNTLY
jgi:hypothetical protein